MGHHLRQSFRQKINREQATKNDQAILAAIKSYIEILDITETKRQLALDLVNQSDIAQLKEIFPEHQAKIDEIYQRVSASRLLDIHELLMEKGIALEGVKGVEYLYHDPLKVASTLMGKNIVLSDRCCGEAGTFAISRPDIATQVRYRKQEEIKKGVKILTSCPACQQGLARYSDETGIEPDYIVVELAKYHLGEN